MSIKPPLIRLNAGHPEYPNPNQIATTGHGGRRLHWRTPCKFNVKAASALARPAWLWEEGIPREWDAKVIWERKFKREVFKRIIQTLSRIGWTVGEQTHIFTDNNSRHCVKGDLQADLKICGRSIELELFQAVNTPDRADHSGRYQSDKEKHMPYLARLEMQRTRIRIRDYLAGGAALEPR